MKVIVVIVTPEWTLVYQTVNIQYRVRVLTEMKEIHHHHQNLLVTASRS